MAERSTRVTAPTMSAGFGRTLLAAAALASALALAPSMGAAQDAPAAAPKPSVRPATPTPTPAKPAAKPAAPAPAAAVQGPALEDDPTPWVKICQKDTDNKTVCLVAKELRSEQGQLVASVAMRDTEGEAKKTLLVAVPPAILVQPGMRVGIDKGKQEEVKYRICFPNACYADFDLSDQMAGDLKKGQMLVVTTLNFAQKPTAFPFRLAGFKTTAEGPGVDPSASQQNQEQLQQQLQKKAEEAAKKLQGGEAPKP